MRFSRRRWIGPVCACLAFAALCGPAAAEVRTKTYINRDPAVGSPADPRLQRVDIRYDATLGAIVYTAQFRTPVVDPQVSSALRNWYVQVFLSETPGTDEGGLLCAFGAYAVEARAFLGRNAAEGEVFPARTVTAQAIWSADRRAVTVKLGGPSLRGRSLVCGAVELSGGGLRGDPVPTYDEFWLEGFRYADANLVPIQRELVDDEALRLAGDLGAKRPWRTSGFARCRRPFGLQPYVSCRGHYRLSSPGRPTLTVRDLAELTLTRNYRRRAEHDGRVSLIWKRCPRQINPRKVGRRCGVRNVRWRGFKSLSRTLLR